MGDKPGFRERYSSMTDIGREVGLSARKVGERLKAAGLRGPDGTPSEAALADGTATSTPLKDGTPHFMWDRHAVMGVLAGSGVDTSRYGRSLASVAECMKEAAGLEDDEDVYVQKFGWMIAEDLERESFPRMDEAIRREPDAVRAAIWSSGHTARTRALVLKWVERRAGKLG